MSQRHIHTPDFRHGYVAGLANQKVFVPRLLPRMLIRTPLMSLSSRLLPNEGGHHTRSEHENIVKHFTDFPSDTQFL
jgi:hypothetical protein